MGIGLQVAKFCGKHLGLYTKKEIVRVCKNVGRELVDIQNGNASISIDVVQKTIKKYAPKINVKICTNRQEVKADLLRHGIKEKEATECVSMFDDAAGISYVHTGGDGKCKGIYTPLNENLPSVLAHELEHYLFGQNSFISKLLPKKILLNETQSARDIQYKLMENVDLSDTLMFRSSIPLQGGKDNIINFLQNFDRLETPKRVQAFFRGLCRSVTHPRNKGAFTDIYGARQVILDEKRAYEITDDIIRYRDGISSENKTGAGIFSELLGYTNEILKKEQKLALFTKASKSTITHGCPSSTKELSTTARMFRDIMNRKNSR